MDKIVQYLIKSTPYFSHEGKKLGSDLPKPYPARHQTTPAVERPRPVPKGLKLHHLV
jgi:hypothetical protein